MNAIADNLQVVRTRIAAAARVAQAHAAGQRAFGENYVQEALEKMDAVPGIEWHLIGPLQSNKTRLVAERFDWVQTVASEKIARRLSEQRPAGRAPLNVLIQVNASGEGTKSGVRPKEAKPLSEKIRDLDGIRLRGLMAIPEPGAPRGRFREVRELYSSLQGEFGFDTLSMGMSDDLELAIAEGATLVRVGTAIFGARRKERSAA